MNQIIHDVILNQIAPVVVSGIVAGLGWLGVKLAGLIKSKLKSTNFGRWSTYAGMAVQYAEAQFGPDTGTGKSKEAEAVRVLLKYTHGQITEAQAQIMVKAAYTALFSAVQPLKNG